MHIDLEHTVRAYHYFSPRKVRDLGDWLKPSGWAKLRAAIAEFGVEILGVDGHIKLNAPEAKSTARALAAVLRKLEQRHDQLGTLDDDTLYIYGKLAMYNGVFNDPTSQSGERVFVTVGTTGRRIIALGGSARNMNGGGGTRPDSPDDGYTVTLEPNLFEALMMQDEEIGLASTDALAADYAGRMYTDWHFNRAGMMEFEVLAQAQQHSHVGRPYLDQEADVLIGSPVWIAQT